MGIEMNKTAVLVAIVALVIGIAGAWMAFTQVYGEDLETASEIKAAMQQDSRYLSRGVAAPAAMAQISCAYHAKTKKRVCKKATPTPRPTATPSPTPRATEATPTPEAVSSAVLDTIVCPTFDRTRTRLKAVPYEGDHPEINLCYGPVNKMIVRLPAGQGTTNLRTIVYSINGTELTHGSASLGSSFSYTGPNGTVSVEFLSYNATASASSRYRVRITPSELLTPTAPPAPNASTISTPTPGSVLAAWGCVNVTLPYTGALARNDCVTFENSTGVNHALKISDIRFNAKNNSAAIHYEFKNYREGEFVIADSYIDGNLPYSRAFGTGYSYAENVNLRINSVEHAMTTAEAVNITLSKA